MRASSNESSVGCAVAALVEVHDVDDQRADIAGELLLVAQRRHPGAGALGRPREIVAEEQAEVAAVRPQHLPRHHVGMPGRDVLAALEGEAEQLVGGVERRIDDVVELEVRLHRRFVDVAADLAQLLGVVAPVPRRDLEVAALLPHQLLHGVAVGERARARRRPDPIEQVAHRVRRLRHGVVEPVVREGLVAEELRALGAQRHHLGDHRLVVGRAALVAARDPGAERLFAQVAARGELQERLDARARQRDDVLAGHAALGRRRARRRAHEVRQAGEVLLALERQRVVLLVGEHVLAEASSRASPAAARSRPAAPWWRRRGRRRRACTWCDSGRARAAARR